MAGNSILATKVREFSLACNDQQLPNKPGLLSVKAVEFITDMVYDELDELAEAKTITEQADALVDAIYYLADIACRHGINIDRLFDIVHTANMQKVVNGRVIKRPDGKVEKPENWVDPGPILEDEVSRQEKEGAFNK